MAEGGEKRSPITHRTPSQIKRHSRDYQARPEQKKKRAARNAARAAVKKKSGAAAVAGKDVGHKKPLSKGGSNASGNLKIQSKKSNRGHGMTRGKKPNMNKKK
jgi:L-lactate utilization protein LutC